MRALRLIVLCALVLAADVAMGQVMTGTPPFGSFGGGPFDVVDLANLNVHFSVPIVNKAGRGTPFYFNLSFDSSIWTPTAGAWVPDTTWGWRTQTDAYVGWVQMHSHSIQCPDEGGTIYGTSYTYNAYYDALGTKHPFNVFVADECVQSSATAVPATDGSGYSLTVDAYNPNTATVYSREGQKMVVPVNTSTGTATTTDSNGNQITTTGSSFTDTLGVTALTISTSGTPPTLSFSYPNPVGGTSSINLIYSTLSVKTNFACSGITEYNQAGTLNNASLPTAIQLPDGSQYTITYEATSGSSGFVTGRIHSISLPTGGSITYTYSSTGANSITCADGSTAWLKRTVNPGGDWTYARSLVTGSQWTTTITAPTTSSDQTVLNFQDIYETSRKEYTGSATGGTLMRSVVTCYNTTTTNCDTTAVALPITKRTATVQLPDASGVQAKNVSVYDATYGTLTKTDEYDYGSVGGAVGSLKRETTIAYATDIGGVPAKPSLVKVFDGGNLGTPVAQTSYGYDETTPSTSGVSTQHQNPTCPTGYTKCRGNLTTQTITTQGSTTLVRTFTYYDTGVLKKATDVNLGQTTYTYTTGTPSCNGAFPTSVSLPISGLSRSMTWNCNGGVPTQVTDENGYNQTTTYSDANFWRPSATQDRSGYTTNLTYVAPSGSAPAAVEAALPFNGSTSTVDVRTTFDGLGRVQYRQRKQAQGAAGTGNYDSVAVLYDSIGRPYQTSMPYQGAAGASMPTGTPVTTVSFDALGRRTGALDGGSGTAGWTYSNNDAVQTVTSPGSNKVRQMEFDGLGRLSSVCEVTGSSGSGSCAQNSSVIGFWTKYTYDALNDLLTVNQNVQSSSNKQSRTYTYDMLGRITSEANPETNNLAYAYVYDSDTTCGTYKGDLVKRTDAVGNITCYAYDAMRRLTGVTHPSGSYSASTPARCFVYDSATVSSQTMQNAKGRVAEAYTTSATCTGTKLTDIGFSYSARGEVTDAYESTPHSGSTYYHVTASYWASGAVDVLSSNLTGLPTLYYGASDGTGLDGEGRVTKVTVPSGNGPNPVTNVVYTTSGTTDAIGFLTKVTFGSSDFDEYSSDPNTGRMIKYKFHMGAANNTVTGNMGWNSDGTLASLNITDQISSANTQNCSFTYDDLSRLASANCGTSIQNQNFTYDPYGNITKTVPGGSQGWSFQSSYSTTTQATNWLTQIGSLTPSYDNNGNVTNDTVHSFAWDAEGKMLSVDSTVVTLTYDALGRMVEQNRGMVYTQIVYGPTGGKLALMNGQTLQKAFVPLPSGAMAVYAPGTTGPIFWRHADWLGSSRLATTQSRTKYYDGAYAPFGENYAGSGTTDLNFTGQNQDTNSNYYDFLFREFSMVQGRWMSPDPAGLTVARPGNPQSWNRYAYTLNNPGALRDYLGLYTPVNPCVIDPHPCVDPTLGGGDGTGLDGGDIAFTCNWWDLSCAPNGICWGNCGPVRTGSAGGGGGVGADARAVVAAVLSSMNDCADFFNAAAAAFASVSATSIVEQVTIILDPNPPSVSDFGGVVSARTTQGGGASGRILLNPNGGFFPPIPVPNGETDYYAVGSFQQGTIGAQAELLLHELGHLINGLPSDAGNPVQSIVNNTNVDERCADAINAAAH